MIADWVLPVGFFGIFLELFFFAFGINCKGRF